MKNVSSPFLFDVSNKTNGRTKLKHSTYRSDMGIVNELKLRGTFQARDYQMGMKNYSATQAVRAISYLREFDAKSKGFGSISPSQGELLKEMIFKIMH